MMARNLKTQNVKTPNNQPHYFNSKRLGRIAIYSLLLFFCVLYLMPLFVMVITSFKSLGDIRTGNLMSLPTEWVLDAWHKAWSTSCTGVKCEGIKSYFWNSFQMVIPAVAISTLMGAFNGYVISKWQFRGSNLLFSLLLFGCFIPFRGVTADGGNARVLWFSEHHNRLSVCSCYLWIGIYHAIFPQLLYWSS